MPVKGLMPGLMEVGKIKIGIKGKMTTSTSGAEFRLPQKIDHFRIVKNERDQNDDYVLDEEIIEIISWHKSTVFDKEKNIIGIPIRLLYNEIDLVFPTQYASYVNAKLSCSGNGEKAHTRDGRETACPCERLDGAYTGKDKCKINGTLSCIIEGSNVGGCYKFRTTSINSARYILSSLMLIKAATGGLLSFIPLRLVINPKKTIIPATGAPTTIYVVTVEFQGGIEELQQKALTMGQERVSLIENMRDIEIEARKIVSCNDADREEREFVEEFYPNSLPDPTEVKPKKEEKVKIVKKKAAAKKKETEGGLRSEPGPGPDPEAVEPPTKKKTDDLLGEVVEINTEDKAIFTEPDPEPEAVEPPAKITRDQLVIILNLKSKTLKIDDQVAWGSLIKKMKFKDVFKANDMTAEQGDKFIEHLKSLAESPI